MVSTLQRLDAVEDADLATFDALWMWFCLLWFVQSLYQGEFLLAGVFLLTAASQACIFEHELNRAYQEVVA